MGTWNPTALSRRGALAGLLSSAGIALIGAGRVDATPFPPGPVRSLAFDGTNLVVASQSFRRSENGGANWTELPTRDASGVTALATHPDRPGRLHASLSTGGVIRSDDGGGTWFVTGTGLPGAAATAIAVAAHAPDTLYVAVAGDGLWRSEDAGNSWAFVMDRPYLNNEERDVLTLASVNNATGMGGIWIYAGTENGLTRVPDCFCRWQGVQAEDAMDALAAGKDIVPTLPLPDGEALIGLALAPGTPDVLFAALASGIWRSADAGVNWTRIRDVAASHLAVDPTDPRHVIAATGNTLSFSSDGGTTWSESRAN